MSPESSPGSYTWGIWIGFSISVAISTCKQMCNDVVKGFMASVSISRGVVWRGLESRTD